MKHKNWRITIILVVVCLIIAVPVLAQSGACTNILAGRSLIIMPFSKHWAEPAVEELAKNHDVENIFKGKNLNTAINAEDFRNLVQKVIAGDYNGIPDSLTREAVVYELTRLWAEKTGQAIDDISVIDEMLIYKDTTDIAPKYYHGIIVAYMKGIAKGRTNGIFDPQAHTTYGELATLLNNTVKAIKAESGTDIEEGSFETKGTYHLTEDKVVFDFELVNHYSKPQQLCFSSGQQFEVVIKDKQGTEVYRYSDGKFFTLALLMKTVQPGEALQWQDAWDMTDKEGKKLTGGDYRAEITVLVIPEENGLEIEESQLITTIAFSLPEKNEAGIIKPETAKAIIQETSQKAMEAIKNKDAAALASLVHPQKGVRFTPYTHVSQEQDVVFSQEEIPDFFNRKQVYLWGYYDGSGEEIRLTPGDYYERFVYSADFLNAEQIGYNEVLSFGNMLENQFEVYENAIVVEYYFPGFDPQYEGMDWQSLRLVFEHYDSSWRLVGIIHNQWTI